MSKKPANVSAWDTWFQKNRNKLFLFFITGGFILSLMSFNAKISEAHDDALYLEGGWRFVHEFPHYFYTQNAPLYPMFLAICIRIFGFKLLLLKFFSVLFYLGAVVFTFLALEGLVPVVIFLVLMFFQTFNYQILYFSGMTFTESFYFFLQSWMFYSFRKFYSPSGFPYEKELHRHAILLALTFFLIGLCKSASVVLVPAYVFFVLTIYLKNKDAKGLKASIWVVLYYMGFRGIYEVLVRLIWKGQNQFKDQLKILLQKDPYDITQGQEDIAGFIQRLTDNTQLYLSKRFFQILGWMSENSIETKPELAFLMVILIVWGIILCYRKNNYYLYFFGLFAFFQSLLSFIILQTRWDQARIILVNMPVLIPLILFLLHEKITRFFAGKVLYYFLSVLIVVSVLISSVKRAWKNYPVALRNLSGDKYYGYTPDWINFLKCSEWCADSLPPQSLVASRKAPMSFVYGKGKRFFPVYSVVKRDTATGQSNPDSALAYFRRNGVTHIMMPQLRLDPNNPGAGFINTIHNILEPIQRKYPDKLKLVHVEGQFEECYLFEFKY